MIDGVLFNVKYLGSTHTECEGRGEKEDRIHQAELAVHEVKVSCLFSILITTKTESKAWITKGKQLYFLIPSAVP